MLTATSPVTLRARPRAASTRATLSTGHRALGRTSLSGRRRLPAPAASTTATRSPRAVVLPAPASSTRRLPGPRAALGAVEQLPDAPAGPPRGVVREGGEGEHPAFLDLEVALLAQAERAADEHGDVVALAFAKSAAHAEQLDRTQGGAELLRAFTADRVLGGLAPPDAAAGQQPSALVGVPHEHDLVAGHQQRLHAEGHGPTDAPAES